jgi:arginyl-tRNA synthetase
MIFNPEESIDFHGFTGPFVQYTYARIKSILRKENIISVDRYELPLLTLEKEVLYNLEQYPQIIQEAGKELNPSVIANYIFQLAKTFNSFYSEHSISNAENNEKKSLRLYLSNMTALVLKNGLKLLGIIVSEKM